MTTPKRSMAIFPVAFILVLMVGGCQSSQSSRLETYLGSPLNQASQLPQVSSLPKNGNLEAGLIVINDSSAQTAAPALSQDTFVHMKGLLRNRLARDFPLTIVKDLSSAERSQQQDFTPVLKLAEEEGLAYVLVAILSSEETRFPTYLPFNGVVQQGGGTRNNPGYETQNFALVEFALLDVKESRVRLVADGTAWATLYTLDNQLKSNVYQVVVRAQQVNPIYPESYANAPDILRAVSADDAMKQAVQQFKEAWTHKG